MPSAGKSFGTQSPPLEATGEDQPMGVSAVGGEKPQVVPDKEQRAAYFETEERDPAAHANEKQMQEHEKTKQD